MKYVINRKTIVFLPHFDKKGNLYTLVIENEIRFIVKMSPRELIEHSMLHFGSDLKGARASSRSILGNVSMLPVKVCGELDIYWFPCKSPEEEIFTWIAHAHVIGSEQIEKNTTKVYLSFGHTITVNISKFSFDKRYDRATKLRHIINERINSPEKYNIDSKSGFQICKDPKTVNYMINGVDEEE